MFSLRMSSHSHSQETATHQRFLTSTPYQDNPEMMFSFIGFLSCEGREARSCDARSFQMVIRNASDRDPEFLREWPKSADHKRGQRKGAASKSVKYIFDTSRHFSRRAKNVKKRKKCQEYLRHFSTIFQFSGPSCGGL